ncbi:MAG: hypothetical protein RLZZ621_1921 [Gemmatimonadota bacterium]
MRVMHRVLGLAMSGLMLNACVRQAVATETSIPGAPAAPSVRPSDGRPAGATTGRSVVVDFLAAVNAQDLQQMAAMWGNAKGLAREQLKREELEKRLIIMQCLMQHDTMRFAEERPRLSTGGRQEYLVELKKGNVTAQTSIMTVAGPGGRWLVEDVDVTKLREFCR